MSGPRTVDKNSETFKYYKTRLQSSLYQDFQNTAHNFGTWMDIEKAFYDEARPVILDLCMAAYWNTLAHLDTPTVPNNNYPINLSLVQVNEWAADYCKMTTQLSKFAYKYNKDAVEQREQLLYLLQTVGLGQATPNYFQSPTPHPPPPPPPSLQPPSESRSSSQPDAGPSQLPSSATSPPRRKMKKKMQPIDLADIVALDVEDFKNSTADPQASVKIEETEGTPQPKADQLSPGQFRNSPVEMRQITTSTRASVEITAGNTPDMQSFGTPVAGDESVDDGRPSEADLRRVADQYMSFDDMDVDPTTGVQSNVIENLEDGTDIEMASQPNFGDASQTAFGANSYETPSIMNEDAMVVSGLSGKNEMYHAVDVPAPAPSRSLSVPVLTRTPVLMFSDVTFPQDTVVLRRLSSPGKTCKISISLTAAQFREIRLWNDRIAESAHIAQAKCLSLCCFLSDELMKPIDTIQPIWPSFQIHMTSTLLPTPIPLETPVDGFVDLCPYLQEGVNELVLMQDIPMPDTGWAVVSHSPTTKQLDVLISELLVPPVAMSVVKIPEVVVEQPISMKEVALPETDEWFGTMQTFYFKQRPAITSSNVATVSLSLKEHGNIQRWNERFQDADDVEHSQCVSLSCYASADILSAKGSKGIRASDLGALIPTWPTIGALRISCGELTDYSLSPPALTNEDGFVDLSPFLQAGENKVEIKQDIGLVEYTMVIFIHRPTRAQLETVVAKRKRDKEWATFLRTIEKPLVLDPAPCPWLTTSA